MNLTSVGYWFTHDGGTSSSVNICGSGRTSNYITSNFGVFKIGDGGTQPNATSCLLDINNISIYSSNNVSYTATGNGVVIYAQESTVRIDNSIVSLTAAASAGVYQYVIWINISYLFVMTSTIEMNSQSTQSAYANGSTSSWLIFENNSVATNDAGRIKVQNSYLSHIGIYGGGAILTNPGNPTTATIFISNVYFHCVGGDKVFTLYNNSNGKQDTLILGGTFMSGGLNPISLPSTGSGFGLGSSVFWNQYPNNATNLAIYGISTGGTAALTRTNRPY